MSTKDVLRCTTAPRVSIFGEEALEKELVFSRHAGAKCCGTRRFDGSLANPYGHEGRCRGTRCFADTG